MLSANVVLLAFLNGVLTSSCEDCLLLTPYIESNQIEVARNLSRVNSNKFLSIVSFSGFITVDKQYDSNLFFWYFPGSRKDNAKVIWLNGGPGISSMTGLFKSIGPFQIVDEQLEPRIMTWLDHHALLFIDSPVGAGYSYTGGGGYVHSVDQVATGLYEFLRQFVSVYPELDRAPLFLAGSSYAGKYVPAFAHRIHTANDGLVNLKGIIMGNALIEPRNMMYYSELCKTLGLVDGAELQHLITLEEAAAKFTDQGNLFNASNKFNETIEYMKKVTGVSVYNFHTEPSKAAPDYEAYIQRPEVRKEIHVGDAVFTYNNQVVYTHMISDVMNSTRFMVEELLEHYGVMVFNGQYDLIIPHALNRHVYKKLRWSRRQEFDSAKRRRLLRKKTIVVGYKRSGGNFAEVVVRRAGHDAPGDQPDVVKYVVDRFIDQYK